MLQINSLILEGTVAENCEVLEPKTGFLVGRFPIRVDRLYKNKQGENVGESSYFDIETYGLMTEKLSSKIVKGRGVRVVGRLKQETWTDSESKNHSRVFVVAEHIEFKLFKQEGENVCNKN